MTTKPKTTRKRKPITPVARVTREGFRFVSETGYRTVIRGPREAIRAEMFRLLPAWLQAALDNGHEATASVLREAIEQELAPVAGTGKFRLDLVGGD